MKKILLSIGLAQLWILISCGSFDEEKSVNTEEQVQQDIVLSGKQLSLKHCQTCHLYPEPSTLDKHTWQRSVLPLMGRYFGIYEDVVPRGEILEGAVDLDLVIQQNIFPEKQLISNQEWSEIEDYFISSAPESLPSLTGNDALYTPLEGFEIIVPHFGNSIEPAISLVKIDPKNSRVYVGESKGNLALLTILDNEFNVIDSIAVMSPPVDVALQGDKLGITLIGTLTLSPSNNHFGEFVHVLHDPKEDKYSPHSRFSDNLNRPVQTILDDISGNGYDDMLISEFGYYTGSLTLFKNTGRSGQYERNILKNVPGAVRTHVRDMNNNGHKDIIALFAQGDEGISIFYNDDQGGFSEERVLRFNPSYGSVYFELVDFNNNGYPDILYCNGDNGDYPPVLKDYHGIRIFENDGNNNFEQVYFFPMHGAYRCSAADFNLDGVLDIVAVSHFPDFQSTQRQDFIYLKNIGNYSFSPRVLQKEIPSRWITFDIADLSGNGYKDILLGAYGTYEDTIGKYDNTLQEGVSLLLLKNLGR